MTTSCYSSKERTCVAELVLVNRPRGKLLMVMMIHVGADFLSDLASVACIPCQGGVPPLEEECEELASA